MKRIFYLLNLKEREFRFHLIAEGFGRRSYREKQQFYLIAYGSALEIETQLHIAK